MMINDKNINLLIFGDSITFGFLLDTPNDTFHQVMKRKYNIKNVTNFGSNGSKLTKSKILNTIEPFMDFDFNMRSKDLPKDIDVMIIFGGTNDFEAGREIGTISSSDVYEFYGAYNTLINNLKLKYPSMELILMTPLKRWDGDKPNAIGYKIIDYANAIINIGKVHNLKVIDAYHEFDIDPHDTSILLDGLHPSKYGHQLLGEYLGKKLFE